MCKMTICFVSNDHWKFVSMSERVAPSKIPLSFRGIHENTTRLFNHVGTICIMSMHYFSISIVAFIPFPAMFPLYTPFKLTFISPCMSLFLLKKIHYCLLSAVQYRHQNKQKFYTGKNLLYIYLYLQFGQYLSTYIQTFISLYQLVCTYIFIRHHNLYIDDLADLDLRLPKSKQT